MLRPPFHYTGNKAKVLPQILSRIPDGCNRHIDLFGGSGVVAINLAKKGHANVIYNEIDQRIAQLFELCVHDTELFADSCGAINRSYLDNKVGYLYLREHYNQLRYRSKFKSSAMLYNLICRSFSNGVRFNRKGEFNLPYGERNHFDKQRILNCEGLDVQVVNGEYEDFNFERNDWVFIDPPYRSTSSHYSESWTEGDDIKLLTDLDLLDRSGVKFCYTNVLRNRNFDNELLREWLTQRDYRVESTVSDFRNTSFRKSDKVTEEVIVTNY